MHVYELRQCDEYWMQDSLGLFSTQEKAEQSITYDIVFVCLDQDKNKIIVTKGKFWETFKEELFSKEKISTIVEKSLYGNYIFYELTEYGYNIYGIIKRKVL